VQAALDVRGRGILGFATMQSAPEGEDCAELRRLVSPWVLMGGLHLYVVEEERVMPGIVDA
jgi:hypothetical protein